MSKKHSTTTRRNFKQASVAAGLDILRQKYGNHFAKVFKSITIDNGSEFSDLADAFKEGCVYFAHPYSSGERGTNEKQHALVRRVVCGTFCLYHIQPCTTAFL